MKRIGLTSHGSLGVRGFFVLALRSVTEGKTSVSDVSDSKSESGLPALMFGVLAVTVILISLVGGTASSSFLRSFLFTAMVENMAKRAGECWAKRACLDSRFHW